MMIETSQGIRVEVHGDAETGGVALYDSRDGTAMGVIAFDGLSVEVGAPLTYRHRGVEAVLPHGEVVNTVIILP